MATLAELDEALLHASLIPADERGKPWHAWVDGLLAQRTRLARTAEQGRETRVMAGVETR